MIRQIPVSELRVGMYVHELDCDWMNHPFLRKRFPVSDEKVIEKIARAGIKRLFIDSTRGRDVDAYPTAAEVLSEAQARLDALEVEPDELPAQLSVAEEMKHARGILNEANRVVTDLLGQARMGKAVEVEQVMPVSKQMVDSVFRNKDAMISLGRIKTADAYTFQHSVNVAALMITFSRAVGLPRETIEEIAIGGLLHDIGKMCVPNEILNKPGKLEPHEFEIMKSHVVHSREILKVTPGITKNALDVAAMHHERYDGTGYPDGLKGDQITQVGQMSAVVDVYDALTSVRCYKDAWEPTFALKKMLQWSPDHFEPALIQRFIRCLGIYPVGTLVELKSGLVGIVSEQAERSLLKPRVRVIFDARRCRYLEPREVDLERSEADEIAEAVNPSQYRIDLGAYL